LPNSPDFGGLPAARRELRARGCCPAPIALASITPAFNRATQSRSFPLRSLRRQPESQNRKTVELPPTESRLDFSLAPR
jgi:hypothetical protein